MTKGEQIQNRIDNCCKAASRTKGLMRKCWIAKMNALILKREDMTIAELSEEV